MGVIHGAVTHGTAIHARSVLVTVLVGLAGACRAEIPEPAAAGACDLQPVSGDRAELPRLFAAAGEPIVVVGGLAGTCTCGARSLRGDGEARTLGGDGEARTLGGDAEARTLGGDAEARTLGGDAEARTLGGDAEARTLGGDAEARTLGGDSEARTLGGDGTAISCVIEPRCTGYIVVSSLPVEVFDGRQLTSAPGNCVAQ